MLETTALLIFWALLVGVILLIGLYALLTRKRPAAQRRMYLTNQSRGIMDLDLRLPYKRFKELYPWTKITYRDYKKLQMERAFRRAVSSQENKRMVR